jgi:hypothetical protein
MCHVTSYALGGWEAKLICQVKTTQDLSTLIRDLQELWLFGGLDTLSNPANEEASQAKAVKVAEMVARLATSKPGQVKQDGMAVKGEER